TAPPGACARRCEATPSRSRRPLPPRATAYSSSTVSSTRWTEARRCRSRCSRFLPPNCDRVPKGDVMLKLLALGLAVLALAPLAGAAAPGRRMPTLPGATAFPESIGVDPHTGSFFTGSVIDGTVYRCSLDAPAATVFLPAGSDGRTNVAGVKVDPQGRVWIAD